MTEASAARSLSSRNPDAERKPLAELVEAPFDKLRDQRYGRSMSPTDGTAASPPHRRDALIAIILTVALAATCVWVVKILGPRATNPDIFCNCSVAEGLIALLAVVALTIGCAVAGFRLKKARGLYRVSGIVAGLAALLLPLVALLASIYLPFPTIEELQGIALLV